VNITITGPREVDDIDIRTFGTLFRFFLGSFDKPDVNWFVGGARGVDTIALHWLWLEGVGHITVVVPHFVSDQPECAQKMIMDVQTYAPERLHVVELEHDLFPEAPAFHDRNHYMVDRSNLTIGFPHRTRPSRGTRATLQYAKDMNVARLEYEIE
jgi:hypothetical protein